RDTGRLTPASAVGPHGSLRNCRTRFDSSARCYCPRGVADASDRAKVGDQVRLLTRMVMTLGADGQATGCKPVEEGSIPTGVSAQLPLGSTSTCFSRQTFVGL